jgi:hypothetical protein
VEGRPRVYLGVKKKNGFWQSTGYTLETMEVSGAGTIGRYNENHETMNNLRTWTGRRVRDDLKSEARKAGVFWKT